MKRIASNLLLVLTLPLSSNLQANNLSEQGQIYLQLQQMQQEIMQLRGMVEEQQYQLRKLEQQQAQAGGQPNVVSQELNETATTPPVSQPQLQVEPGDPAREKEFYDAAFSLIRQRDFPRAQQAFDIFLKKYPNGQYAANAHYWYGEVCLVQEDLDNAGQSFAKVIHSWPEHSKAVDSMYKLAMVEIRLGQQQKAKEILQTIINEYPRSSAAKLAQKELQHL